jgi:putative SOS response-associated peptidase YedK
MCGRFDLIATPQQVIETFDLQTILDFQPSYNIAPSQDVLAIVPADESEDNQRQLVWLKWGLIPSWAKDVKLGNSLINARAETVAVKPSFRAAFKKRRALIMATGFYEWRQSGQGKQPYRICAKNNQLFAFAGLWEHWDQQSESVYSCAIITTVANELMLPIHSRMPVILKPENYHDWLSTKSKSEALLNLMSVDGYEGFSSYPVSHYVNNPRHNDPACINSVEKMVN